jgi:hypothetical protein
MFACGSLSLCLTHTQSLWPQLASSFREGGLSLRKGHVMNWSWLRSLMMSVLDPGQSVPVICVHSCRPFVSFSSCILILSLSLRSLTSLSLSLSLIIQQFPPPPPRRLESVAKSRVAMAATKPEICGGQKSSRVTGT